MKVLDLFSGIGGFSLGLERAGMETVAFCEIDSFCQKVLKKHWPDVPIFDDVRSLNYNGSVDLICGGFPCQPFSVAGNQKGEDDDRHLWPFMFGLIKKHRPHWVIGENVAGFINMALDNVLSDLESEGYTTRTFVIPACAINAPHRRSRVWIMGYAEHNGLSTSEKREEFNKTIYDNEERQEETCKSQGTGGSGNHEIMADSSKLFCDVSKNNTAKSVGQKSEFGTESCASNERTMEQWDVEPAVGRVANGVPDRVDRLKGLGNAVVPQIPEILGRAIMEIENDS